MKIRPTVSGAKPSLHRAASQVATQAKKKVAADVKTHASSFRDVFEKATGAVRAKISAARKLVKPDFKAIAQGLRTGNTTQVLAGATSLANRVGVAFVPPIGANVRQLVTTLGQQIVSPTFTLSGVGLKDLHTVSIGRVAGISPLKGRTNDPDTSLRG